MFCDNQSLFDWKASSTGCLKGTLFKNAYGQKLQLKHVKAAASTTAPSAFGRLRRKIHRSGFMKLMRDSRSYNQALAVIDRSTLPLLEWIIEQVAVIACSARSQEVKTNAQDSQSFLIIAVCLCIMKRLSHHTSEIPCSLAASYSNTVFVNATCLPTSM